MSSIGRNEGIEAGEEEEPYVTAAAAADAPVAAVVVPPGWDVVCRLADVDVDAAEVWGRVNSSKRSASRGWCMWMYVAEESLLCSGLVVVCIYGVTRVRVAEGGNVPY